MSTTNGDVIVLTWLALKFWVASKALWAPTYCLVVVDMTESTKPTWTFKNARTGAALINASQGVITVIIIEALWINLCDWRF